MYTFVFTCGDVNGIGPEIVIKTLNKIVKKKQQDRYYFICPPDIFKLTADLIQPIFDFSIVNNIESHNSSSVLVINPGNVGQKIGIPTVSSGRTAYNALKISFNLVKRRYSDAIITAPISKVAINKAGINFPGQTEMFAEWTKTKNYVMTFLSKKVRAALLTIHKPLKDVPNLIKRNKLDALIEVIINTLKRDLNIANPQIAVLGLNPHAGENGLFGKEENSIIIPALNKYKRRVSISGTFSSDAFFGSRNYSNFDMIVGMYHDQVLIPFKMLSFGKGVNYTAGLPIVRTSPDHGVAYDIAGKGMADESSMIHAFKYARQIVINRKKNVEKNKF